MQQFVHRQLMYLVVIQSVFTAVSGSRLRWQRMERYGSLQAPARLKPSGDDRTAALPQPQPYGVPLQPVPNDTTQWY
ncbi:hypothetical protein AB0L75_14570 [Streptomyces sp. NPDC052101]|uniref:hypothetical protein n=1 Tax=Streptomyces sp. NPDC052101 TaxID=3155763 RepID=UPI003417BC61